MRLAAQEKCGFYPAPADAVLALSKHLTLGDKREKGAFHILDPCAGEGCAINQLASWVNVPQPDIYCIELDQGRGQKTRELMPDANVLSPCSFFTAGVQSFGYGLLYVNPPFDDELGGGQRNELTFLRECHHLLCTDGVLAFVVPWNTICNSEVKMHCDTHYREAYLYRFPTLKYNEACYIGIKRSIPWVTEKAYGDGFLHNQLKCGNYYGGPAGAEDLDPLGTPASTWEEGKRTGVEQALRVWRIPSTWRPSRFLKAGYLPGELETRLAESPLNGLLVHTPVPALGRPPLPVVAGQVALMLAAGSLNGRVDLPGGQSHVVRGVSSKEEYLNEDACETTIREDGKSMRVKEVYSEQVKLEVRAVGSDGVIHTYASTSKKVGEDRVEIQYKDAS
jgi:hypothetical protein